MASCASVFDKVQTGAHCVTVRVGGIAIGLRTRDAEFARVLGQRYGHFVVARAEPDFEFDLQLAQPFGEERLDDDVRVWSEAGTWFLERGDFRAQWNPATRRGTMRHLPNPYSVDAVLRIVHSLVLARRGGFLLHASSAIRNGRAFLFAGVSGAGKTTIARLAPSDAALLTDEISYACPGRAGYRAYGTPFAGELATLGEDQEAPIAGVYLLEKGQKNRVQPVARAEAVRALLRNMLFFAHEEELVDRLFATACRFVEHVPVRRLSFVPEAGVWGLIQ